MKSNRLRRHQVKLASAVVDRVWPYWVAGGLLVIGALDLGGVALFQAFPSVEVSAVNAVAYESNTLGSRPSQTIYQGLRNDQLSDKQRRSVTFKDNSYISNVSAIKSALADNSGLYLQGYVAVPKLGIYNPIYYGTSDTVLAHGAGTAKDDQIMGRGNYAISAHNMGSYVNWSVPVPAVSGGRIQPGSYFTALQSNTPDYIYTTDGEMIYTFKQAAKFGTNVGDSNVLTDSYPYDGKTYSYLARNANLKSLGVYKTSVGLGLDSGNNVKEKVGSYDFASMIQDDNDHTVYTVSFKSDYVYADQLKAKNFKVLVQSDGINIPNVNAIIQKVEFKNGELTLSLKLSGDVSGAAATVGSQLVVQQLQDKAFVTLTTCVVPPSGALSSQRIVDTGVLVKKQSFMKAPKKIQALFPDIVKTPTVVTTGDKGVTGLPINHVSWWQKILASIVRGLSAQSSWLHQLFGK